MTKTAVTLLLTLCASLGLGIWQTDPSHPQQPVDPMNERSLKVTIATIGPLLGPPTDRYKFGDRIPVTIGLTNTSNRPAYACISSDLYQDIPKLTKNGEVLPYAKSQAELLRNYQEEQTCEIYDLPDKEMLKPNQPNVVEVLMVQDDLHTPIGAEAWYDVLKPGVYELSIKRRLSCCDGPVVESNQISFEVVP